jgi:hypothetical protein
VRLKCHTEKLNGYGVTRIQRMNYFFFKVLTRIKISVTKITVPKFSCFKELNTAINNVQIYLHHTYPNLQVNKIELTVINGIQVKSWEPAGVVTDP